MRLKDRNESPVGGFYYDDPITGDRVESGGNFDSLVRAVENWLTIKGQEIPPKLSALIEDQICMRQPPNRCFYTKGVGDQISKVIHGVASVVDRVAGTDLEKKARGCSRCGKRRVRLN